MPMITVISEFYMKDGDCNCLPDAKGALKNAVHQIKGEISGMNKTAWSILENAYVPEDEWFTFT